VVAATTDGGTGRRPAPSAPPTAAPNRGPSRTFCWRIPSRPPKAPVAAPTSTGLRRVSRPAAQPSGATSAALVAIRCHSGGISPRRCRARATDSEAASTAAPAAAAQAGRARTLMTGEGRPGHAADDARGEDLIPPLRRFPRLFPCHAHNVLRPRARHAATVRGLPARASGRVTAAYPGQSSPARVNGTRRRLLRRWFAWLMPRRGLDQITIGARRWSPVLG